MGKASCTGDSTPEYLPWNVRRLRRFHGSKTIIKIRPITVNARVNEKRSESTENFVKKGSTFELKSKKKPKTKHFCKKVIFSIEKY
jgi:hypothetical protein